MVFSQRELATVLAALRFWARTGISGTPLEHSIATEGDVLRPLNTEEVDVLCERLNTVDDHEAKRVLVSVSGGVADIACDPGVEVAVFDHDAFASDPEATAGVPSSFKGLAEVLGVPVEAHHE